MNGLKITPREKRPGNGRRRGSSPWVYVTITLLLISSIGFALARSSSFHKSYANYDPHGVIVIDGDTELEIQAAAENWQGNGSELNPFLIQGYEIVAMGYPVGIYVGNTSHHLIIDNCYVHDATIACISLHSVTNVTVARTECYGGQRGIEAVSSWCVRIVGNNCTNAIDEGVYLQDSDWCSVTGNNCSGNSIGVGAQSCNNLSIQFNSAHRNRFSGMVVLQTSHFLLANNTCTGGQFGVREILSEFGSIVNSAASDSSCSGFYLSSCRACSVEKSRSSGHGSCGISVENATGCRVRENDCTDNQECGIHIKDSYECELADNHCQGNGDCGIRCYGLVQGDITGNNLDMSEGDGLFVSLSSGVNVSDNVCCEVRAGMRFSACESCHAINNTISDSVFGITVSDSLGMVLRENSMTGNGIFVEGTVPEHWNTHDVGPTNLANGVPVAYLVSAVGLRIAAAASQVILIECIDVAIDGLDLSNATAGVQIAFSDGITVSNSSCSNGYIGVYGYNSSNVTVEDSNCSSNVRSGVELKLCSLCHVRQVMCEGNEEFGVCLSASPACEIALCRISGAAKGTSTEYAPSAGSVMENKKPDCSSGVFAVNADDLELHLNEISDCGYGVRLVDSLSTHMIANSLVGCGLYVESDVMACWDSHVIDPGNLVNGRALVYLAGASGTSLPQSAGQIVLAGCSNIAATSMNLSGCTVGLLAGFSDHVSVTDCNLSGNQLGAELAGCADCSVVSSTISDCVLDGVRLRGCSNTTIEDDEVNRCTIGISVDRGPSPSRENRIIGNNVSECTHAIMIGGSPNTTVERNKLLSSFACGVLVGNASDAIIRNNTCSGSGDSAISISASSRCVVANNTCEMNRRGIYLWGSLDCSVTGNILYANTEHGACLDYTCSGNRIWNNVFAFNNGSKESYDPLRAQACDNGTGNWWNTSDMPCGQGNYWHDWVGPDANMDGIVDMSYNISGSAHAKDSCPLAETSIRIEPILEYGFTF